MKGQTDFAEILEDFIMIIFFGMLIWVINSTLLGHASYVHNIASSRIAIDLGENILGASCLTEKKGVFLESKLNDFEDMPCLELGDKYKDVIVDIKLATKSEIWTFREGYLLMEKGVQISKYYFPALVKKDDGTTLPAILSVSITRSFGR